MRLKQRERGTRLLVSILIGVLFAAAAVAGSTPASDDKITAEQILTKHLESIGTAEARAAITSRLELGTVTSTLLIGGSGQIKGNAVIASTGSKCLFGAVFTNQEYPHDKMAFNGKQLTIAELSPGNYSRLASFFKRYEMPFREGLFTGTLSSTWPLLNKADWNSTFKYAGTRKIDGHEVYVLKYQAKNDAGLKTSLYFDAETFRHVRTEYERHQTQQMPTQPGVTQQQGDAIVKMIEEFSDFKTEGGLTLPHRYKLQLSLESLKERFLQDWDFTLTKFVFNRPMADDEFDAKSPAQARGGRLGGVPLTVADQLFLLL